STSTSTFMAELANTSQVVSPDMGDRGVYGIGSADRAHVHESIPNEARAAVQKRLFVRSTPAQEGAWAWFSPTKVHSRSKAFPAGWNEDLAAGALPRGTAGQRPVRRRRPDPDAGRQGHQDRAGQPRQRDRPVLERQHDHHGPEAAGALHL